MKANQPVAKEILRLNILLDLQGRRRGGEERRQVRRARRGEEREIKHRLEQSLSLNC
jgi:hypothetical protein